MGSAIGILGTITSGVAKSNSSGNAILTHASHIYLAIFILPIRLARVTDHGWLLQIAIQA
jgi:hypothetical protein